MDSDSDLKKKILDAAKNLACTPNDEASVLAPEFTEKIHGLLDACEDLLRCNAEIIQWVNVLDRTPAADETILILGKMQVDDKNACVWLGGYEAAENVWLADGIELDSVSHWARLPKGSAQ